jgi:hypothetical protein
MLAGLAADAVVILHGLFVLFVVAGWALVWRWPRAAWVHLPAAAWGAAIEFGGWICPLTPLEHRLRAAAGESSYHRGFIEYYVLRYLYPEGLQRADQIVLGVSVLVINLLAYSWILRRFRSRTPSA